MAQGEYPQYEGEDLEATRPNPRLQAERQSLRDDLKGIAEQVNDEQAEVELSKTEEQERADRIAKRQDDFFAEGGISGYWANNRWFVENAAGQYISFDTTEDAMRARMASEERLAKRAKGAQKEVSGFDGNPEVPAPKVEAPAAKPPEAPPQPELSPEALQAREALEDRILGSVSREIRRTMFGGIMVKGAGETLSYRTPEEYEQARLGFIARKEKREADTQIGAPQQPTPVKETVVVERPLEKGARISPGQPTTDKPGEEMAPEQTEILRANQDAHNRFKELDNMMTALRGISDNELRDIGYRLQNAGDGAAGAIFQMHRNFTDTLNRSARSLMEAQGQTKAMLSTEGAQLLKQAVQQQAREVDRAYEEMSRNLTNLLYGDTLPYGSKTRADLEAYLRRTQPARQQLARLAQ